MIAPQPPGPGLPLHAPSVQISIVSMVSVMAREVARHDPRVAAEMLAAADRHELG
jgi:hypothetical protein